VVTPFSFGIYVSKIKEGMMMEDPEDAIERLFHEMSQKVTEHPCR
jgi:ATP-dependent Lhr-like helicase